MAWLALALYLVWATVALVVRAVMQLRATGDSGLRLRAETPFSTHWWARIAFTVAIVLGGAAPVLALLHVVDPMSLPDAVRALGAAIAIAGIALTFAAQLTMGGSWRVGVDPTERTELVTGGLFRYLRNPIFTTMAVTAVGLTLLVPSLVALAGVVLLVWSLEYQVRGVEEPYLRMTHGAAYDAYAARVGRFVPGVGRRPRR